MKTWLITGCSSGLGRSIASAVLQKGYQAVVTARDVGSQLILSLYKLVYSPRQGQHGNSFPG